MGKVLSIDLAYKSARDFGICVVGTSKGKSLNVAFIPSSELIQDPPDAGQCAMAITDFCKKRKIRVVLIDGPQGWKDPESPLAHSRQCERLLFTQGKTGTVGFAKPALFIPFAEFSIRLFAELIGLGGQLVSGVVAKPPKDGLLVAESYPTSAWRKLGIKPLPGKATAKPVDMRDRLLKLQELLRLQVDKEPTHDELQALVASIAGVAILGGNPSGYCVQGSPPKEVGGVRLEGFIVNPCIEGLAPFAADSKPRSAPDAATLERMLYYLKLTREAEARIEQVLYRQGKIVGGVYIGRGQEAIGVGSALQLKEGDLVLPSHRDFSSFLIRGFSLADIFANWMGRADSPTRGRDNTLHIGNMKLGIIPIISPLGGTCPVACGVAMVLKWRKQGNVAVVHLGEGTTSVGQVHEAMNMAGVMKLPVIFVINNNGYAFSTPVEKQFAIKNLSERGPAYGMPGETIDGTDVQVVYRAVGEAIARARRGEGPSLLECKTFRMTGHSAHDAAEYVPARQLQAWAKKDPIPRLEKHLLSRRVMTRESIASLDRRIQKEIDAAVADAEARPDPQGESALQGVYCGPECWWKSRSQEQEARSKK